MRRMLDQGPTNVARSQAIGQDQIPSRYTEACMSSDVISTKFSYNFLSPTSACLRSYIRLFGFASATLRDQDPSRAAHLISHELKSLMPPSLSSIPATFFPSPPYTPLQLPLLSPTFSSPELPVLHPTRHQLLSSSSAVGSNRGSSTQLAPALTRQYRSRHRIGKTSR